MDLFVEYNRTWCFDSNEVYTQQKLLTRQERRHRLGGIDGRHLAQRWCMCKHPMLYFSTQV